MLSRLMSAVIQGIHARPVDIEVSLSQGPPSIVVVGSPDASIRESRDRIMAAIRNSGFAVPARKTIINLAPASLPKGGALLDLPIALGILIATGQLTPKTSPSFPIVGELGLDGRLVRLGSCLSIGVLAKEQTRKAIMLPYESASYVSQVGLDEVFGPENLVDAVHLLEEGSPGAQSSVYAPSADAPVRLYPDFEDIRGQPQAARLAEIVAVGYHNLLLIGPPGSGKTMFAQRLPGVFPPLSAEQSLETSMIYDSRGMLDSRHGLIEQVPFRSPHHSSPPIAILGGGSSPRPGELSMAHNGVLFLDEFPEFHNEVIQGLRQPLEDRKITISRASATTVFPAACVLIAAMNPCPCGYASHPDASRCKCTPRQIERYQSRVSGPVMDRIDLKMTFPPPSLEAWENAERSSSSKLIRERVMAAREFAAHRDPHIKTVNAFIDGDELTEVCRLSQKNRSFLLQVAEKMGLGGRGLNKVLRVGRTLADLKLCDEVGEDEIYEGLYFRTGTTAM